MTTATRKPARETHGTCRLTAACPLALPAALDAGEALLIITPERGDPTTYTVLRLADKDGRTVGYRLTRLAWFVVDRKVYDIDLAGGFGPSCDCPDAQFRSRECKHVRCLLAALKHAGVRVEVSRPAAPPVEMEDL